MPITLSELHDIRSDCFADDIAIDEVLMREWSHDEARQHFESGGTCFPIVIPSSTPTVIGSPAAGADRHALLMSLGACLPNAPLPNVPLEEAEVDPAKWAPCTTSGPVPGPSACPQSGRIFCVSDLHTDYAANMEWCRQLADSGSFVGDVLIVAGDVTASLPLLRETLELLSRAFAKVFLTPGNHDLWVKGRANQGGLHIRPKPISSLEKLEEIRQLCAQIGEHCGLHKRAACLGCVARCTHRLRAWAALQVAHTGCVFARAAFNSAATAAAPPLLPLPIAWRHMHMHHLHMHHMHMHIHAPLPIAWRYTC